MGAEAIVARRRSTRLTGRKRSLGPPPRLLPVVGETGRAGWGAGLPCLIDVAGGRAGPAGAGLTGGFCGGEAGRRGGFCAGGEAGGLGVAGLAGGVAGGFCVPPRINLPGLPLSFSVTITSFGDSEQLAVNSQQSLANCSLFTVYY